MVPEKYCIKITVQVLHEYGIIVKIRSIYTRDVAGSTSHSQAPIAVHTDTIMRTTVKENVKSMW